ncbi:aminoglycoside phosphotransferase family protein [Streptacidiphilus jiangxiensis]|uniref:Streptomycin 6-kinase n=1 Tax=Streptacidiphilus jiangxiensis TaxID=235985 RepID=A0A1H7ZSX0_STRJI|nr:aminoglycoside phosphotransferase family protein [Streptacidiphilus jiangxiensis]SEM61356.1 streptomycin 6-kinase [Streptacidiphilus jiangxiensis]
MTAPAISIPARLQETVRCWTSESGQAWLDALPGLAEAYLAQWELTLERVCEPGGQISLVLLVRRADGSPAALKLGYPHPEGEQEHAALAHWDGHGAVRMYACAPQDGAMLLERAQGDVSLRSLPESKAMLEALGTLRRLWVAPPEAHPFTSVADYVGGLREVLTRRRTMPAAAELRPLVDEALDVSAGMLQDSTTRDERLLLHGDYHHGNVLAAERSPWLAIDPKPLVGERAYDLAWLAQDRLDTLAGSPGPEAAARRRLQRLAADAAVDPERLRGWTLFRTVEAGLWSLDVGDTRHASLFLEFAAML